ncbi:MAG: hypothetical protein WKF32_00145 [Thermoleophilaceae bacterium]
MPEFGGLLIVVAVAFDALLADVANLAMVPIFLIAIVLVRGLPALVYRRAIDARRTAVAALLQATTLPFVVTATTIGIELKLVSPAESAALIAAGLLSVMLFPLAGVLLLRGTEPPESEEPESDGPPPMMAM